MSKGNAAAEGKPKVFICYASEDRDLLANFVRKFKAFNHELDASFYDQIPTHPSEDKTMHARFIRFAKKCEVALILGSAPLAMPDSYASKNELPILKERRQSEGLILVGVKLRDFDLEEWNEDGIIDFAQIFFSNMPKSRATHKNKDEDNKQLAIYNQIDEDDQDTYHKLLKDWIKKLLEEAKKNIKPAKPENGKDSDDNNKTEQGDESITQQIVKKMKVQDTLLADFEERLRKTPQFWEDSAIDKPSDIYSCYTWYFLGQLGDWYEDISIKIKGQNNVQFKKHFTELNENISIRNEILMALCDTNTHNYLSLAVRDLIGCLSDSVSSMMNAHAIGEIKQDIDLKVSQVSIKLKEFSKKALEISKTN